MEHFSNHTVGIWNPTFQNLQSFKNWTFSKVGFGMVPISNGLDISYKAMVPTIWKPEKQMIFFIKWFKTILKFGLSNSICNPPYFQPIKIRISDPNYQDNPLVSY